MAKIGRNQPCPCGSGKKYKQCCLANLGVVSMQEQAQQMKISLQSAIEKVQQAAVEGRATFHELGVFLLYSDAQGDAWLFEVTEADAVQIAEQRRALEVPIEENAETIAIHFSHTFAIHHRRVQLTAYDDSAQSMLEFAPTQQLHAAMRRIFKRFPSAMLDQMHVAEDVAQG